MYNAIVVASVQHTGTNSVRHLVEKHYPDYKVLSSKEVKKFRPYLYKPLVLKENIFLRGHISAYVFDIFLMFGEHFPLILPLRDPLLTLLSHHYRKQQAKDRELKWVNILAGWYLWTTFFATEKFIHVPIDLPNKPKVRDIDFNKIKQKNSSGDYDLKKAYEQKDIGFIKSNIENDAWRTLCSMEFMLRPKLESFGYTNLFWWDTTDFYSKENIRLFFSSNIYYNRSCHLENYVRKLVRQQMLGKENG